ncbi:hypothetical protein M378DRAFT_164807 [Amanita muscaria Koide BX008]|uniref:Uncharacterized protein n=1 Tax=Amanita muscaria (strain Koide BX008) TaxID=946122 RepID=A0A0C2T8Z6_AMAMK|nr:hypothetical protein M378DRAFT_164807 [Amanita muscaria Koide BX008]
MIEARDNDERARMTPWRLEKHRRSRMEHILQESFEPCTKTSTRDEMRSPDQADMNQRQGQEEEQPNEENETTIIRQRPQSESSSSPWIEHTEDTLKPQE